MFDAYEVTVLKDILLAYIYNFVSHKYGVQIILFFFSWTVGLQKEYFYPTHSCMFNANEGKILKDLLLAYIYTQLSFTQI